MAFNPNNSRGFNRFGMVRGQGQLQGGSPYLDQPRVQDERSQQPQEDPQERNRRLLAAALQQRNQQGGGNQTQPAGQGYRYADPATQPAQDQQAQVPAPGPMGRDQRDQLQWGNVGTMRGFEVGSDYGGDLKARNSVKNTFGRLASKYAHNNEGLAQLMEDPEFKAAFPNAKIVHNPNKAATDKIDFGGVLSDFESGVPVGIVDVLEALQDDGSSSTGWQWLDEGNSAPALPAATAFTQAAGPVDPSQQENIIKALLGQANQSGISIEQLLQSLLNGNQTEDPLGNAGIFSDFLR